MKNITYEIPKNNKEIGVKYMVINLKLTVSLFKYSGIKPAWMCYARLFVIQTGLNL
jgi:hypothetical protein